MSDDTHRPSYDELPLLKGTSIPTAWGQYGDSDELGAVSLLTPDRVREAAAECVRTGERFAVQLPLDLPDPPLYGRQPIQHQVYSTFPGGTDDRLDSFYPQGSTQWDGFGHFGHPTAGFYNGFSMEDVLERGKLGIHNPAARGIVGRGVLVDVPRHLERQGVSLPPDERAEISADTLLAALADQGSTLRTGDILCVRTGWIGHYKSLDLAARTALAEASHSLGFSSPGLAPADGIARLVWDNGIVALAVDNTGVEPAPPPMVGEPEPAPDQDNLVHMRVMAMLGVHLGEFFDFDALAEACAQDGRYEFLLVSAPLSVSGGVGSPPNAIAIR